MFQNELSYRKNESKQCEIKAKLQEFQQLMMEKMHFFQYYPGNIDFLIIPG